MEIGSGTLEEAVEEVKRQLDEAIKKIDLQLKKDGAKAEHAEAYEAINGQKPTAEQAKEAYEAIQNAADLGGINSALGQAVKDLINGYAESSSKSGLFGNIAADIGAEIDSAAGEATAAGEVADLSDLVQKADDAFAFVEAYPGANKPFDEVTGGDGQSLAEAAGALDGVSDEIRQILDAAAKDEGYADYAEKLEDMLGKAQFEAAREAAIEEAEKLVREHDGEHVRDVLEEMTDAIAAIVYEPNQPDGYFEEKAEELEAASAAAETEIRHAQ